MARKQTQLEVSDIDAVLGRSRLSSDQKRVGSQGQVQKSASKPAWQKHRAIEASVERARAGDNKGATVAARSAAGGAPLAPPPSNTGGKGVEPLSGPVLRCEDGRVVEISARRGYGGETAFVDWVNVTCHESEFFWTSVLQPVTDDQVMANVSLWAQNIFGFGITSKRERGANFYTRSYELGESWGMVCHGGQRNTLLVMLTGEGCTAAKEGWEGRLRQWLEGSETGRITRVDLAYDDFSGDQYSVDRALQDYRDGNFVTYGREPDCEQRGNWQSPNGKGRTFNVGHRTNGKFARIYEKGRHLGDKESEWVRVEGELKSVDRIIPFDVLTDAGAYLAAMYPAFEWINDRAIRIKTTQKTAQVKYDAYVDWLKSQCGAAIWFCAEIEGGIEKLFEKIKREVAPRRLVVPDFQHSPAPLYSGA